MNEELKRFLDLLVTAWFLVWSVTNISLLLADKNSWFLTVMSVLSIALFLNKVKKIFKPTPPNQ